jgi:hypothetical protein
MNPATPGEINGRVRAATLNRQTPPTLEEVKAFGKKPHRSLIP